MCCGDAADRSEDNVKGDEDERIIEDEGEEEVGDRGAVDGILRIDIQDMTQ